MVVPTEDELRSEECAAPGEEPSRAEPPVSQPDPYCAVPLNCPGYACTLRVSVVACLFAAWTATRKAARRWAHARDQRLWRRNVAEADLHALLQMPDAPAFTVDLQLALLSVRGPDCRPHPMSPPVHRGAQGKCSTGHRGKFRAQGKYRQVCITTKNLVCRQQPAGQP